MTKNKIKNYILLYCILLTGFLLVDDTTYASEPDPATMVGIAAQYKGEHAVYTNYTEHLVIRFEDGKLVANSECTSEKLLISSIALSNDNWNYAPHSFYHQLTGINGAAYTPVGNSYNKNTEVDYGIVGDESVFYDDNVITVQKFPDVTEGSVISTNYTVEHTDMHLMPTFRFQKEIPLKKVVFEVSAPDYVKMRFVIKGSNTEWIQEKKETRKGITHYTFSANDVPAYKHFPGVPSSLYYIPHIIPVIVSYTLPGEEKPTEVSSGTAKLYEFDHKYINNLNVAKDTDLAKIVEDITKKETTAYGKAAKIYKWVQENIHYIAFEQGLEGFTPREASIVCTRKYGDCKDMTSILVAMYRLAGLTATYSWIGTEDIPYSYEEVPLPNADNHMICALKINNDWTFVDGTHPELPFGANRDDIQGKEALISIDPKNYKVVTIPETADTTNVLTDSTFMEFYGTEVFGHLKIHATGYHAWDLAAAMMYVKTEDREKVIKKLTQRGSDKYNVTKYDYKQSRTGNKDMDITATFTIRDEVAYYKKQHFINMNLNSSFEDMRIDTAGRKVPYYTGYKQVIKQVVVMQIPDSMKLAYLPKPASGNLEGVMSYNMTYIADKKTITLVKEYKMVTRCIMPEKFVAFNAMLNSLDKQYKEEVVLKAKK